MDIRGLCVFTALAFLFVPSPAFPEDKEAQALKKFIEKSRIEHDNPHIKLGCPACHGTSDVRKAADGTVPLAVPGGVSKLCYSCHGSYSNIHPVDVVPSMQAPAHLPLYEGKLSCDTCHDMHQ